MPTARQHRMPAVSKEQKEAEEIAKTMYQPLTAPGAPRATPTGYILGACQVLKMLTEQAVQQGSDKEKVKTMIQAFVISI